MTLQELREELEKIIEENGPEILDYDIVLNHNMIKNELLYVFSVTVDHNNQKIILD